jgi:hypothetical protein
MSVPDMDDLLDQLEEEVARDKLKEDQNKGIRFILAITG